MYCKVKEYQQAGKASVRTKTVKGCTYELVCYTKDQFFSGDWDDFSIAHRGLVYRDGVQVNNPFPKIFNLRENKRTEESKVRSLMETEHYEVLDKINGHLVIVSYDLDNDVVLTSTKGSFEGELCEQDEKLVQQLGIDRRMKQSCLNYTLMFECLADYDKHLWYEDQLKIYSPRGNNTLVLLGAIKNYTKTSMPHNELATLAFTLGVPVTDRFEFDEDVGKWFDHKGKEGYVIHFPYLNYRVKVKTKEYVRLHYMKEITVEKMVNKLANSGLANLYKEYDEELYPIFDALLEDFVSFVEGTKITTDFIGWAEENIDLSDRKSIALSEHLNDVQKMWLFRGMPDVEELINSKSLRLDFKENGLFFSTESSIKEIFSKALYS